jgi:hypothetical protein
MNNPTEIKMFFSSFATQLPILLVCLAACVIVLVRWKDAPRASLWALLGFGLSLGLCIVVPVVQTSVQTWMIRSGDAPSRTSVFAALALLWSVLRAVSYALLLVAVFAGRSGSPQPNRSLP